MPDLQTTDNGLEQHLDSIEYAAIQYVVNREISWRSETAKCAEFYWYGQLVMRVEAARHE